MRRLCVVCEGETEANFVDNCLGPYLTERSDFSVYAPLLKAPSGRHRGGHVSVDRLAEFVSCQYFQADRVTTLVDYYGFEDIRGRNKTELEAVILQAVMRRSERINPLYVMPYVQMHEFEGLLFSDTDAFALLMDDWTEETRRELQKIRKAFATPEDINNGPMTSPAKRLQNLFPNFSKNVHGVLLAEHIGVDKMKEQCPLFRAWLESLLAWQ